VVWTDEDREVAAAVMVEAGRVGEELAELLGRVGVHFARVEPFTQAGKYVRGLLSDLPRKNCRTLAEYAGTPTPDRMQRLLERASWNTFAVMRAGLRRGRILANGDIVTKTAQLVQTIHDAQGRDSATVVACDGH
jgi:hypothetical protein